MDSVRFNYLTYTFKIVQCLKYQYYTIYTTYDGVSKSFRTESITK
jgi:hypothetical protein